MNRSPRSTLARLLLLLTLLALPALACSTFSGDSDGDSAIVVDSAGDEQSSESSSDSSDPADASSSDTSGASASESDASSSDGDEASQEETEQADSGATGETETDSESEGGESGQTAGAEGSTSDDGGTSEASGESSSTSQSSDAGSQGSGPISSSDDPQETLTQALVTGTQIDQMRVKISDMQVEGVSGDLTIEVVRPDRFRLMMEGLEMVVIGPAVYMKAAGTDWISLPSETGTPIDGLLTSFGGGFTPFSSAEEVTTGLEDVKFLGSETLNGLETLVYEYNQNIPGDQVSQVAKVWVGVDDGLVYRQELSGTYGGQPVSGVFEFEYGPDIVIEPPI